MNPLDRNNDERVDLKDFTGQTSGINSSPFAQQLIARQKNLNPIDQRGQERKNLSPQVLNPTYERNIGMSSPRDLSPSTLNNKWNSRNSSSLRQEELARREAFNSSGQVHNLPIQREVIEKPMVVHEHIHSVEKEIVQPVIHREREQIDVKQITQQLHETQIQPTIIQRRELAPQINQPIIERSTPIEENIIYPSRDVDQPSRSVIIKPTIVEENIKKTVIKEIQPVLERDIIQSTLIRETQPIYEKVLEAPHIQREVLPVRELGSSQGLNSLDRNADGRIDSQDFIGQQRYSQQGRMSSSGQLYVEPGIANEALDRNGYRMINERDFVRQRGISSYNSLDQIGDGRIDSQDLNGQRYNQGLYQQQGLIGQQQQINGDGGIDSQDFQKSSIQNYNYRDRNEDGWIDSQDLNGQRYNQGSSRQQGGLIAQQQRVLNPLDRNNDGRIDSQDFQRSGMQQGGIMIRTQQMSPLDRNMNETIDNQKISPLNYQISSQGYRQPFQSGQNLSSLPMGSGFQSNQQMDGNQSSFISHDISQYAAEGGNIRHAEGLVGGLHQSRIASYGSLNQPLGQYGQQGIQQPIQQRYILQDQQRIYDQQDQYLLNRQVPQQYGRYGQQVIQQSQSLGSQGLFGVSQYAAEGGPITYAQTGGRIGVKEFPTAVRGQQPIMYGNQAPINYRQI